MSVIDPITTIHAAVTVALRPFFPARQWHIEAMPSPLTLNEFKALTGRTPWLGISWGAFEPGQGSTRALNGDQQLRVTVCVKNPLREARFFGDRVGPGLYPALSTVASVIHGTAVDGVGTLLVSRVAQLFADGYADDTIAIGAVDVRCNTAFGDWNGEAASAPAFAHLISQFELDAGDGSTRPIATDTTQIPQDEDA